MASRLTFGLTSQEEESYRCSSAEKDQKLTRYGLFIVAAAWIVFAFNDYYLFGATWVFLFFAILRCTMCAVTLWAAFYIVKIKTYRKYDQVMLLLSLSLITVMLSINATRHQNFLTHTIITSAVTLLVGIYIPTKLSIQTTLAALTCFGEISAVLLSVPWSFGLFTVAFSLVAVFLVTVVCSYNLQLFRRQAFKSMVDLSILKSKLESHSLELEGIVAEKTRQLKHSERLSAIGMTAGMIGHDIRNPLQAIEGDIFLLRDGLERMPQSSYKVEVAESIQGIEDNVCYINKIVADLQDFSRPLNPHAVNVDLESLVSKTLEAVSFPANISLKVDVDAPFNVFVDPEFFRRILTNLVLNAIQAMPNGGALSVSVLKRAASLKLMVADTGLGIPDEVKPKLFTPMVTTKSKGQGLGLAVVKRLVEAMDGSITYVSHVGKGTKFTVELPCKHKPETN